MWQIKSAHKRLELTVNRVNSLIFLLCWRTLTKRTPSLWSPWRFFINSFMNAWHTHLLCTYFICLEYTPLVPRITASKKSNSDHKINTLKMLQRSLGNIPSIFQQPWKIWNIRKRDLILFVLINSVFVSVLCFSDTFESTRGSLFRFIYF